MRGVLKALVAVELQLCSDPLFLFPHGKTNGVQHQIHRLLCSGLVGGVVKKSLATNCQESFELETFHRVRVFASERR